MMGAVKFMLPNRLDLPGRHDVLCQRPSLWHDLLSGGSGVFRSLQFHVCMSFGADSLWRDLHDARGLLWRNGGLRGGNDLHRRGVLRQRPSVRPNLLWIWPGVLRGHLRHRRDVLRRCDLRAGQHLHRR